VPKFLLALMALAVPLLPSAASAAGPQPLTVSASGANGAGTALVPGIPCAEGGSGDSWHHDYTAELPAGTGRLAPSLPSELRLHVDVHADPTARTPRRTYAGGFLAGGSNQAVLANARGSVRIDLRKGAGDCTQPTAVGFDGTTATVTGGSWTVVDGSGAYEGATGTGSFNLQAAVAPGADNPFSVQLNGTVDALDPTITVAHIGSYWANLGVDYLNRVVTSVYRFTNTGPGDAFAVKITKVEDTTVGASPGLGAADLGDLAAGESIEITVRHRLALLGPCQLILLNCRVATNFTVIAPDALDVGTPTVLPALAIAPNLPPPL
jgi:hypothetical protein